ncbi:MAG TPA: hypothetical protein VKU01_04695 [Bryobacteraceae bacterium]|nr:hypothetical protein [Bryobacteraceae bacterium]
MDITKLLDELKSERRMVEDAIITLERLAKGLGKRRGRPPGWMATRPDSAPRRRGRPPGSKNKPKDVSAAG